MIRRLAVSTLAVLLVGCATQPSIVPAVSDLAPWTEKLSEQQPDDAFAAIYRHGNQRLVFIGALHENQVNSKTFHMIDEAFRRYRFNSVITEGYPTSKGANPERLVKEAGEAATSDGFQLSGEAVPAERGALSQGAEIWGGEPDDTDVKAYVLARGVGADDLLGFYALRSIPQWIREKKIASAADSRLDALVDSELTRQRQRLGIDAAILPDARSFRVWYAKLQRRPLDDQFTTEETGPRSDGMFPTNRIGAAISQARDAHLHQLMLRQMNEGKSVLVVYGGSHLMIHRPALDRALGKPCYFGDDLFKSVKDC